MAAQRRAEAYTRYKDWRLAENQRRAEQWVERERIRYRGKKNGSAMRSGRKQRMKMNYYPDTDSLYVDFSNKPSVESQEVTPGIILDYDEAGQICGIDVDHASQKYDLPQLELEGVETYFLSESALAKDWFRPEEDKAWKDL
ncbi:MAG: DUF2283 domain-containing protein [Janthinobacterium lividum]